MFSEEKHRIVAASFGALEFMPGGLLDERLEFIANLLGIAGFALSLTLMLVGALMRLGRRRPATQGDLERLAGTVARRIGDRIAVQLAAAAASASAVAPSVGPSTAASSSETAQSLADIGGAELGPAAPGADRVRLDLEAAVSMIVEDTSPEARVAAAALLAGDALPAERLLERRAAQARRRDTAKAAETLHLLAALRSARDLEGALAPCLKAVRVDPDSMLGWRRLGYLLLRLGRAKEARDAFDRALKLAEVQKTHQTAQQASKNSWPSR